MSGQNDKIFRDENQSSEVISTVYLDTRQSQTLGFTLRGGLEYGIGIYVSEVDVGSQAERKGLCKGDRILRVNGHNLKYALQKEALALITARREAVLVVKHSGHLPFIDDESCQLVWKDVRDFGESRKFLHNLPSSRDHASGVCKRKDNSNVVVRVPRETFSCGRALEGVDTRYGVLIDAVMSGSICSQLGIEQGDELLDINGINLHGLSTSQISILLNDKHINSVRIKRYQGGHIVLSAEDGIGTQEVRRSKEKVRIVHKDEVRLSELTPSEREYIDSASAHHSRIPYTADTPAYGSSLASKYLPNKGIMSKHSTAIRPQASASLEVHPALFQDRSSERLSPIPESREFTNSQLKGRTLKVVRIPKNGCDIGMDIEGGAGSVYRGKIIVSKITKYGLVGRNGEIRVGDQIMMVNGSNLVDISLGEAQKLLRKAVKDRKDYLEFIIPSRPKLYYERDSAV